jgi:hypothetical protein
MRALRLSVYEQDSVNEFKSNKKGIYDNNNI